MTLGTQAKIWGVILVAFVVFLVLLKSILLPFVAGMAIAYLLDPTCDRLERMGCSRDLATVIVTAIFAVVVILFLLLIVPLALQEAVAFLGSLPDFISRTQDRLVAQSEREDIRKLAAELCETEREHVTLLEAWLSRFQPPPKGWNEDPDPPLLQG